MALSARQFRSHLCRRDFDRLRVQLKSTKESNHERQDKREGGMGQAEAYVPVNLDVTVR